MYLIYTAVVIKPIVANTISGIVVNEKKQPIEFANITLFKINDSLPITTTLSDSLGVFTFSNVEGNNYLIEVSYVGYITDSIIVQDNGIQLSEIQLKLSTNTLNEVQVTASNPIYERKSDRIIFNVENSTYSQGSNALQALSKAPRVQVNNNDINIMGSGIASVLINDRPIRMNGEELAQYLKGIPSSDIQKIEIIPNPSAKYEAQGAALINIVLKKNRKQGYNGSITGSFSQAQYQGGSLGFVFNYTKKKVSFNSSITNVISKDYRNEIHLLKYTDQTWSDTTTNPQLYNNLFGRIGLNVDINDKNTLGFNYNVIWNKVFWDKEHIITRVHNNINDALIQSIKNEADNTRNFYNFSFTTYYTLKIDTTGKKLNLGFVLFNNDRNMNRNYTNATFNRVDSLLSKPIPQENTNGKQKSYIYIFNADMEHPVKYGTWQYGVKFTYFNVSSDNKQSVLLTDNIYQLDSTRSNLFCYKEFNEAIYGGFNKSFKKLELEFGLRLEYTQLKGTLITIGNVNKQQYIRPFPSLMIQYKKSDNHQFNFSVSSRIDRPAFYRLNPFKYYYNQFTYGDGNPTLQPLFRYTFSLNYLLKQNHSFSIYYNYSKNVAGQVTYIENKNIHFRWEADRQLHSLGITIGSKFNIRDRWIPNLVIDAHVDFLNSAYLFNTNKREYWAMSLSFNNDFIFDKNNRFSGNLNCYFTPNGYGQTELTMRTYFDLSMGIKLQLLKRKKLILAITGENLIKSIGTNGYKINPTGEYFSFTNYYNDRVFTFSVMYRFGNEDLKIKSKQVENIDIKRTK